MVGVEAIDSWSARLDARGYHITPARRYDVVARWAGETRSVTDEDDGTDLGGGRHDHGDRPDERVALHHLLRRRPQ